MRIAPGQVVGPYQVEEHVFTERRAATYRVRHQALGSRHLLRVVVAASPTAQLQLLAEGKRQSALTHENLHRVTDAVQLSEGVALVFEDFEHALLEEWLASRPSLAWEEAVDLMVGVVRAVGAIHRAGLVHRGLDPSAILVAGEGRATAKVTAFRAATSASDVAVEAGVSMGRAGFAAPEQLRDARRVDMRADLFALGALFYLVLAGRPPFGGGDDFAVHRRVMSGEFEPLAQACPQVPEGVRAVVEALLASDPVDRPQSADAILERLAEVQRQEEHRRLALLMWSKVYGVALSPAPTLRLSDIVTAAVFGLAAVLTLAVH